MPGKVPDYITAMLASIRLPAPDPNKRISLVALDSALSGVPFARRATIVRELKTAKLI